MILIDKDLLDFSFSHVYLLLCKKSERIDEPILKKAYDLVLGKCAYEKNLILLIFLQKTHLATEIHV